MMKLAFPKTVRKRVGELAGQTPKIQRNSYRGRKQNKVRFDPFELTQAVSPKAERLKVEHQKVRMTHLQVKSIKMRMLARLRWKQITRSLELAYLSQFLSVTASIGCESTKLALTF